MFTGEGSDTQVLGLKRKYFVRYGVLTGVLLMIQIFWDVAMC